MANVRVGKLDAAGRQIDAAIRMTFANEDPLAIHTVVAAGHRIIRDICEQRGDIKSYLDFTDWKNSADQGDFWRRVNKTANFLKHADRDANAIHEFDDETSDFMILFGAKWYGDLGSIRSIEMRCFMGWWALNNPAVLTPRMKQKLSNASTLKAEEMSKLFCELNRKDSLVAGNVFLQKALQRGDLRG